MSPRRRHPIPIRRLQRGVSLVEVMVAATVGLLVALAVITAVVSAGRTYATVTSTVSAQSGAQVGLSLIDLSARSAGGGFYASGKPLCPTWNAWNGVSMVSNGARLMPVRIVDGGPGTVSDQIVFTGGSGARALAVAPVMTDAVGTNIQVSIGGGFAIGDVAVIGAPGSGQPCTLFEVTQAPTVVSACGGNATQCQLLVRNPNASLNPSPGVFTTQPTFAFDNSGSGVGPAAVSRVASSAGEFRQDAFAVQCGALVRYNAFRMASLPPCTTNPLTFGAGVDAIASDVVLLQAQYGVSSSAASDVVTQWVDATGGTWGGTAPSGDDIARIKAVRLVLVARAREPDAGNVSDACTNAAGVANAGPCGFEDASAPVIDLGAVPVPAGRTWRNYRYRVHAAVIPLRTVIWSD